MSQRIKSILIFVLALSILSSFSVRYAGAVPVLQLYIEGSTYDASTETWVITSDHFNLWVMGNISGPGGAGAIKDVFLTGAHPSLESGTISLTPIKTTYSGIPDSSLPSTPTIAGSGDGTQPLMGDGSPLPAHGIFGPGTAWTEYAIGDFTLKDSPVADLIDFFPAYPGSGWTNAAGQINAYAVSISGYSWVHFDAFDHVGSGTHIKYKFAPFSHDSEAQVPEPGTLLLLGTGLIGLAGFGRKKTGR